MAQQGLDLASTPTAELEAELRRRSVLLPLPPPLATHSASDSEFRAWIVPSAQRHSLVAALQQEVAAADGGEALHWRQAKPGQPCIHVPSAVGRDENGVLDDDDGEPPSAGIGAILRSCVPAADSAIVVWRRFGGTLLGVRVEDGGLTPGGLQSAYHTVAHAAADAAAASTAPKQEPKYYTSRNCTWHLCPPSERRDGAVHALYNDTTTMLPWLPQLCPMDWAALRERRSGDRLGLTAGTSMFLDIVHTATGELIGTTGFREISLPRPPLGASIGGDADADADGGGGEAEWGIVVARRFQRRGICAESFAACVGLAATDRRLQGVERLTATTMPSNRRMISCLLKAGMVLSATAPVDHGDGFLWQAFEMRIPTAGFGGGGGRIAYAPVEFQCNDLTAQHQMIEQSLFGLLICSSHVRGYGAGAGGPEWRGRGEGPLLSHVPVVFDRTAGHLGAIRCHVARTNPLALALQQPFCHCTMVFLGPNHYISPSWYVSPSQQLAGVPTYNFTAVYTRVQPRLLDESETAASLAELAATHEASLLCDESSKRATCGGDAAAKGWSVGEVDEESVLRPMRAMILAFEMKILQIEGKRKLSQNREAEDAAAVIQALRRQASEGGQGGKGDGAAAELARQMEAEYRVMYGDGSGGGGGSGGSGGGGGGGGGRARL